ncbi:hypothetical protein ACIQWN_37135 [Streptomyces vinaceus]|uniref:hypothetical protein n=1 Tax=Streptomyces vinaceus TaxID=1960 RepID=UPI003828252F
MIYAIGYVQTSGEDVTPVLDPFAGPGTVVHTTHMPGITVKGFGSPIGPGLSRSRAVDLVLGGGDDSGAPCEQWVLSPVCAVERQRHREAFPDLHEQLAFVERRTPLGDFLRELRRTGVSEVCLLTYPSPDRSRIRDTDSREGEFEFIALHCGLEAAARESLDAAERYLAHLTPAQRSLVLLAGPSWVVSQRAFHRLPPVSDDIGSWRRTTAWMVPGARVSGHDATLLSVSAAGRRRLDQMAARLTAWPEAAGYLANWLNDVDSRDGPWVQHVRRGLAPLGAHASLMRFEDRILPVVASMWGVGKTPDTWAHFLEGFLALGGGDESTWAGARSADQRALARVDDPEPFFQSMMARAVGWGGDFGRRWTELLNGSYGQSVGGPLCLLAARRGTGTERSLHSLIEAHGNAVGVRCRMSTASDQQD